MTKSHDNIILNAYLVPLYDEKVRKSTFSLCKKAEIDLCSHVYPTEHWTEETHTIEWYLDAMREADSYGMTLMTMDTEIQHMHGKDREYVKKYAEQFRDVSGFGGFFIVDEPLNPNIYAYIENALCEVIPANNNVNFFPRGCYPEGTYIKQLCDYGAITNENTFLSLDAYCYRYDGPYQREELYCNYDNLRVAGLKTQRNTAVYIQSVGLNGGYRRPERAAMRHNMLTAVAFGIKELKFFTWGTPPYEEGDYTTSVFDRECQPTDLYDEAVRTDHVIHSFGKYLAHCDCRAVYLTKKAGDVCEILPSHCPVQIADDSDVLLSVFVSRENPQQQFIMLVNNDLENGHTIRLKYGGVLREVNPQSGIIENAVNEGGEWVSELEAGDAAVFAVEDGTFDFDAKLKDSDNLTPYAFISATSSAGAEKRYLYHICDGVADGEGARVLFGDKCDQYITFDFGKERQVNRVDVYPCGYKEECGRYYPKHFQIQTSIDGINWSTVAEYVKDVSLIDRVPVFEFEKFSVRFVRICIFCQGGMPNYAEIGEVCIYNDDGSVPRDIETGAEESSFTVEEREDIALGKPVVGYSSTFNQPSWGCSHQFITDGTEKVWASELYAHDTPDATEWICIDLCGEYDINKIRILPQEVANGSNGFPVNYNISVSLDGERFTQMTHFEGDYGQTDCSARELPTAPIKARFVKFEATKLGKSGVKDAGYAIELREIEVYAVK